MWSASEALFGLAAVSSAWHVSAELTGLLHLPFCRSLMAQGKLLQRLGDGVLVDMAFATLVRALSLVLSVTVARSLSESDYGAVSLALAVFGISEALSDLSLGTALVRRAECSVDTVDVAWTIGVIRGALLTGGMFLGAAPLASVLGHPEVIEHLRILSFGALAKAVGSLHVVRFQRELQFGKAFLVENSRTVFGTGISIVLLVISGEPSSLVIGPVVGNSITSVLTWIFVAPRPRVRFSRQDGRELVVFGRWLMGQNLFLYLFSTLDSVYVGRYLGLAAVGAYAFAWRIVNTIMTFLTRAMPRMLIPAYASMQSDRPRLFETARTAMAVASCAGALLGSILLLGAPDLFLLLGGSDKWQEAVPVARALTLYTFSRILTGAIGAVLLALDEPRLMTITSGVQVVLLLPGLVIGHRLGGLTGVAIAVSVIAALRTLSLSVAAHSRFQFSVRTQVRAVLPSVAVATPVAALVTPVLALPVSPALRLSLVALCMSAGFLMTWELARTRLGRSTWPPLARPVFDFVASGYGRLRRRLRFSGAE